MESHFYNVDISWQSDRKGVMTSPELDAINQQDTSIEVATPPQFPKGIEGIWSPEHLLTAAVSSCLMTTFLAVAENSRLEFISFDCKSRGKLQQVDGKYMMSEVVLEPILKIKHEKDRAKAEKVILKSERACLITNSIKASVSMDMKIIVED